MNGGRRRGRWPGVAWLLVLAVGTAACGSGTDPARLAVGDCFDVPGGSDEIGSISKRACTDPHKGEVFHVFETDAPSDTYPGDADWELIVYPICDPEFESYTGTLVADREDIGYLYLVPTADRWTAGDRRVTCFISSLDGSPLTESERAS